MSGDPEPAARPQAATLAQEAAQDDGGMNGLSAAGLAGLAGVTEAEVQRLVELGILGCRRPMSGWPGPVVIQGGDYFGRTVNLAARIAARAGPGRVLVSQHVAESAPPGRCGLHGRR